MSFSLKVSDVAKNENSFGKDIDPSEWSEWNDYLYDLVDAEEILDEKNNLVKTKTVGGIVNLIVEAGKQENIQKFDSKKALPAEGEENSSEELEVIERFPNNYFEWEKDDKGKISRKHCWPQYLPEVLIAVDLPEIMVDYNKHPASDEEGEKLTPLRVSLNEKFRGEISRHIILRVDKDGKMNDKNMLYKIAKASGKLQEFIDSKYDIGVIAGAKCNWDLIYSKSQGKEDIVYHNIALRDPSKIEDMVHKGKVLASREEQLADIKCDVPFTGILLNGGDYPEDTLLHLRSEYINCLKKGEGWEDTGLCKALTARTEAFKEKMKQEKGEGGNTSTETPASSEDTSSDESIDSFDENGFDDDIPL